MIGGGVPKNFTQDIVVAAEVLGHEEGLYAHLCRTNHRSR